jgi:ferredoxin
MDQIVTLFLIITGIIFTLGFGYFTLISHLEGERRAARVALGFALAGGLVFSGLVTAPTSFQFGAAVVLLTLGISALVLFALPIGRIEMGNEVPGHRFDEREIMFARHALQPGSSEYTAYYQMHPEHEVEDNKTRAKPGLLSPEAKFANPYQFAASEGSFFLTRSLQDAVDGPVSNQVHSLPPREMTAYLTNLAIFYGATEAGVTLLQPYHVYSHIGRGAGTWGEEIPLEHKYAIAFTVEMDYDFVCTGPYPPTTMETARQYVESARVAVQLAAAIREMGYPARAHIDANYRVIAPLVAREAGLGEIGRMTILITPRQGSRVRLGVVTTNAELVPSKRTPGEAIIDFCNICEKCAQNCPSQSIPSGPREEVEGAWRWVLSPDTCFRYWNVAGTDCSRCMRVCPFSHPDSLSHNLIRWGIARSGAFRRAALWLDDLFYGAKPGRGAGPEWAKVPKEPKESP